MVPEIPERPYPDDVQMEKCADRPSGRADASVFQRAWKDPFGSQGRRPEGNRADGTCLWASHAYAGGCVPAGDDRIRYGDLPDAPWRRGRHCTL